MTVKVIDGMTGVSVPNAQVASSTTDSTGQATLKFTSPGFYSLKAYRTDSVRSNALIVEVTS